MSEHIPTLSQLQSQYSDPEELSQAATEALELHEARLFAFPTDRDLRASEQRQYEAHREAIAELRTFVAEARATRLRQSRARTGSTTFSGAPDPAVATGVRSQALRMVDAEPNLAPERGDRLHELIRSEDPDCDGQLIAARTVLTMDPAYRTALARLLTQAQPLLTDQEIRAVRAVQDFERRTATIGTDSAGGFAVPVVIDPTVVLTAQGSMNPFVGLARVETITNDAWRGLTSAGVTWSFRDELATTTDGSPTFAQPEIPVQRADGYIPFSIEAGQDIVNFEAEMGRLLSSGYNELLVDKFTTGAGSGSNEPRGIETALDANTNVEVAVTTSSEIGGVDIRNLWASLPARTRNSDRTAWMSSVNVKEHLRRLAADPAGVGEGDPTFAMTDGRLLERLYRVNEYMDDLPNDTSTANLAIVGDWSGFVIAQRAGMRVEMIPHLFDVTNNRPIGARALFAWSRVGSDSIDDLRFRVLQNPEAP